MRLFHALMIGQSWLYGPSHPPVVTPRLNAEVINPPIAPENNGSLLDARWLSTGARQPSARPNPILSMLRGIRIVHTDLQNGYCNKKWWVSKSCGHQY